ncbi:hypothetical protein AB0J72_12360 [Dactylosporangium sp. NPDC049742]|uniref:hypothetical protein n=1 Tax=Dactylosporangium sp. NPDC049742 TaxID=3154737 RepID=UPI003412DE22
MGEAVNVINLDEPAERAARPSAVARWRRRVPVKAVALVVLGVLVGAVAGQRWEAARQEGRRAAEVSLFVTVAGTESAQGDGTRLTIDGTVTVLNGGPRPVQVTGADVVADVMVWGDHRIEPGAAGWFRVNATIPCTDDAASRPLRVGLVAVTEDGVRRPVTTALQLNGSSWQDQVRRGCPRR